MRVMRNAWSLRNCNDGPITLTLTLTLELDLNLDLTLDVTLDLNLDLNLDLTLAKFVVIDLLP